MSKHQYLLTTMGAISLTGSNSQTFLQGQLTCDVQQLNKPGDYSLGACCDHKGRMLANFWVLRSHDNFVLILPKTMQQAVIEHLQKYAAFSKVTLTVNTDLTFVAVDHAKLADIDKNERHTYIITLPNTNRHLCILENNTAHTPDDKQWLKENINDCFCLLTPKTSLLFTPQMISLEKLGGVSFDKGCYVGQEIVARTQHLGKLKRHIHRIEITTTRCPEPGAPLLNSQQDKVGTICCAVQTSTTKAIALAVIEDRLFSEDQANQFCLQENLN